MIGTIIGHLIGSEYSRSEMKSTLRIRERDPIVDTICLIAICKTFTETGITDLIELSEAIKSNIQKYTGLYSESKDQMMNSILPSYFNNNNVGIQVPPVAWVATTVEEALLISDCVTATTANCPEAIKEARAITFAIFLARHGTEKDKIRQSIQQRFYPSISCFTSRNSIMRQKLAVFRFISAHMTITEISVCVFIQNGWLIRALRCFEQFPIPHMDYLDKK